nr:MAG TPA: hypothetical protein [Caudoviricetes sp.]
MISERLYFFILSSLYFAGQPCYNGLDPVVGLARCVFGRRHRAIFFYTAFGKWVTVLAGVLLLRSRYILRPLPSGRASLAVSIL